MTQKLMLGNVVYGFDAEVCKWVMDRIPSGVVAPGSIGLGIVKGTKLIAGVVFENFNGAHIWGSIAVDDHGWANKDTLFRIFDYPFNQLGVEAISIMTSSTNPEAINLVTKFGFKPHAMVRFAAHDGSTMIVMQMLRSECRWIRDGKRQQQGTSGP